MNTGKAHVRHQGGLVRVGSFQIGLGGLRDLVPEDLTRFDVVIPLRDRYEKLTDGFSGELRPYPMVDFGGVPEDWSQFIEKVVGRLDEGQRVLAFCTASHGRTGTLLASLIARLEAKIKDPIRVARRRHCCEAVETLAQARGVFALRGQSVPERYLTTLRY